MFDLKYSTVCSSQKQGNLNSEIEKASVKVFEPLLEKSSCSSKTNDYIYVSLNSSSKIKYRFLVPKSYQKLLNDTLLAPSNINQYFLRTKLTYSTYMILLSKADIRKCFGIQELSTNVNLNLFLKFLSDSSVHTLVSLNDLRFEQSSDPSQMLSFLNEIWGQNHFLLEEILAEIDENNKKVTFSFNFSSVLFSSTRKA